MSAGSSGAPRGASPGAGKSEKLPNGSGDFGGTAPVAGGEPQGDGEEDGALLDSERGESLGAWLEGGGDHGDVG